MRTEIFLLSCPDCSLAVIHHTGCRKMTDDTFDFLNFRRTQCQWQLLLDYCRPWQLCFVFFSFVEDCSLYIVSSWIHSNTFPLNNPFPSKFSFVSLGVFLSSSKRGISEEFLSIGYGIFHSSDLLRHLSNRKNLRTAKMKLLSLLKKLYLFGWQSKTPNLTVCKAPPIPSVKPEFHLLHVWLCAHTHTLYTEVMRCLEKATWSLLWLSGFILNVRSRKADLWFYSSSCNTELQ